MPLVTLKKVGNHMIGRARILVAIAALVGSVPVHSSEGEDIVQYLNNVMPNTTWTDAKPLPSFPGYFHLSFSGRDQDTQYYFDAERKVLVVGMMVNLNVKTKRAQEQSIAPGADEQ